MNEAGSILDGVAKGIATILSRLEHEKDQNTDRVLSNEDVIDAVQSEENSEAETPVAGACIRCTCCTERISEVRVYSKESHGVILEEEGEQLNHKDTAIDGVFSECTNTEGGVCTIDILDNIWFDPDENTSVGGGYALDINASYMICQTGYGMIYLTDSGQSRRNMEEMWIDEMLDKLICEEAFQKMGWNTSDLIENYGEDVFEELKRHMKKYDLVNVVSIKMFLATIRHESWGGSKKLEEDYSDDHYYDNKTYTENVRGAGLIQISKTDQENFLKDIYEDLPASDPIKAIILEYIRGYSTENQITDNSYTGGSLNMSASVFISEYYPIESAVWYWAGQTKLSYSSGVREGQKESLNELVVRHANDNQYNTFAVTQMAVNGTAYYAYALDRFCECENDCSIKPKIDSGCEIEHDVDTGYCFHLTEAPEVNNGDNIRHDYGPRNWKDRVNAYADACSYINNEMVEAYIPKQWDEDENG